jgi:nucleotide-binding universal stress UspA family protein
MTIITTTALVVGTDGSPNRDRQVREAAQLAQARNVPLHVVCSVPRVSAFAQRALDDPLPADMGWLAGHTGQRTAAMADVRSMLSGYGIDVHVTASDSPVGRAVRATARRLGGEVHGATRRRLQLRLPAFTQRARATA